jgi:hypothetical protein
MVPLATMFLTGFANLVVLLPASQKVMAERRAQGEQGYLMELTLAADTKQKRKTESDRGILRHIPRRC